jgi:hypothetical protein
MEPATDEQADSDSSYSSSNASPAPRASKFKGDPATWRQYTHDERLVSTSLTKLRNQDLSAHLFNAHVMTNRHHLPDVMKVKHLETWAPKVYSPFL